MTIFHLQLNLSMITGKILTTGGIIKKLKKLELSIVINLLNRIKTRL